MKKVVLKDEAVELVEDDSQDSEDERRLDAREEGRGSEQEEERQRLNVERRRRTVGKAAEQEDGDGEEEEEDEDANGDLSLMIVEKAKKRRKVEARRREEVVIVEGVVERVEEQHVVDTRSNEGNSIAHDEGKEPLSRSETPEEGELQEDEEGNLVLASDLFEPEDSPGEKGGKRKRKEKRKKERKEKKEKKKKKKKGEDNDQSKGKSEKSRGKEVKLLDAEESIVMRKLLRGPRYFDPPEEQDQTCYNCGKVGHLAIDCPDERRLKPCYVCGTFGHDGRECPQKTDCYVCGKVGHIAKNCPNKGVRTPRRREDDNICLLCGGSGHEASSCYSNYDQQDLEQVQCYVCKDFGHLSCVTIVDSSPVPVSCFSCGEMGHTGTRCTRSHRTDRDKDRPATLCFKCGEEGHFARECSKHRRAPWPAPWPAEDQEYSGIDLTTPSPKFQRRNGGGRWMDLHQREGRWTPPVRQHPLDPLSGHRSHGSSSKRGSETATEGNDMDYMGPIGNFVSGANDNSSKSRRRKPWSGGSGRKRF